MKLIFAFFILLFTTIFLILNLGKFLDATNEPSQSELLVCLGGGISKNRVEKTLELYKSGYLKGEYVLFTGVKKIDKKTSDSFDKNTTILINGDLKNTMEEILYTKEVVNVKNLKSVTIITEIPHSKRVKIFWDYFGENLKNVKLTIVASNLESWNNNSYYNNPSNFKYALSELGKLVYNFFLYGILETFGLKDEFESHYKKEIRKLKKELTLFTK